MISPIDKEWVVLTPRQKIQRVCEATGLSQAELGVVLQTTRMNRLSYYQNKEELPPKIDHILRILADLRPGNGKLVRKQGGNVWKIGMSHTLLGLETRKARYEGKPRREKHLQGTRLAMDLAERVYARIESDEFLSKTLIVKVESFFDRERYRGEVKIKDLNPKGTGRWVDIVITENENPKKGESGWKIAVIGLHPERSPFPYHFAPKYTVEDQRLEVIADMVAQFLAPWVATLSKMKVETS